MPAPPDPATTVLIGIDCACDPKKVGLARAEWTAGGKAKVSHVLLGRGGSFIPDTVSGWILDAERSLLAMDAPLGWPKTMGPKLIEHTAGELIETPSNDLFRRETDRAVYRLLKKTPLDVGADRIARTAHAALVLLDELRNHTSLPIPLAWKSSYAEKSSVIEVYPAGTLIAHNLPAKGYKDNKKHRAMRVEIRDRLRDTSLALEDTHSCVLDSADCLDAVVCTLAAANFLRGHAIGPEHSKLAEKEGWIWVRKKKGDPSLPGKDL